MRSTWERRIYFCRYISLCISPLVAAAIDEWMKTIFNQCRRAGLATANWTLSSNDMSIHTYTGSQTFGHKLHLYRGRCGGPWKFILSPTSGAKFGCSVSGHVGVWLCVFNRVQKFGSLVSWLLGVAGMIDHKNCLFPKRITMTKLVAVGRIW